MSMTANLARLHGEIIFLLSVERPRPVLIYLCRSTLYPILQSRIGQETLISRITRLREDERFKTVGPDSIIIDVSSTSEEGDGGAGSDPSRGEAWLDWSFVEFVKGNYCECVLLHQCANVDLDRCALQDTVQRAIMADPDTLPPSSCTLSFD